MWLHHPLFWGKRHSGGGTTPPPSGGGARQPGGFSGGVSGRPDHTERKRIAAEIRALYRDVYDKPDVAAKEEAAALVAAYVPVNAPAIPPPALIDWEMLADENAAMIAVFRAGLLHIQEMLAARLAQQDDEDATTVLLLAD